MSGLLLEHLLGEVGHGLLVIVRRLLSYGRPWPRMTVSWGAKKAMIQARSQSVPPGGKQTASLTKGQQRELYNRLSQPTRIVSSAHELLFGKTEGVVF